MDKLSKKEINFINKAAHCDYNRVWKCKHPKQRGIRCTEICEFYYNSHEKEEVETIKN